MKEIAGDKIRWVRGGSPGARVGLTFWRGSNSLQALPVDGAKLESGLNVFILIVFNERRSVRKPWVSQSMDAPATDGG